MNVSVVVCEDCNDVALLAMHWERDIRGTDTLMCSCGSICFTLLEIDEEFVPEGALTVDKNFEEKIEREWNKDE